MSREADIARLAKAMGWTWSIERTPYGEPMWFTDEDKTRTRGFNPFVSAESWMTLAEWVRTQPWFLWFCVEGNELVHTVQIDYLMPSRKKAIGDGPLQEAFPLAVLAVLDEMKAETD